MAAAKIASLDINLRGNTTDLNGALDKAGVGLNKFRQQVNTQCAGADKRLSSIGSGVSGAIQNAIINPVGALGTLGSKLLNAILHPVTTIKSAIGSLQATCQAIGQSIIGSFMGVGKGILSTMLLPIRLIASAIMGLYSVVKPIVVTITSIGISVVKSAIMGLYSVVKPIVVTITSIGISVVKAAIASIPKVASFLIKCAITGINLIKSAILAIPRAISFLVRFGSIGIAIVKSAIMSIPKATRFIVNIASKGLSVVKAAIASIPKATSFVVNIASKGSGAIKAGISGLKTAMSSIGSAASQGLSGLASGASSAISALSGMVSIGGIAATGIGAVAIGAAACGAAIVGLAGAGLYLANQQAPIIASMHRTAQVLGMSTQAFSALASTAGMSSEQFGEGLEHLERSLSEAAQGGGEAAQALARVGLSAQNLMKGNPDQQLNQLADAMKKIPTQGEKLALAVKLFGRSAGPEFVAALQNGQEGLDKFRARAERFGLTFTAEQAEIVKKSNKAWREFGLGLQGVGNTLAIALAPAWQWIGEAMGNFFAKISGWVKAALPYFQLLWTGIETVLNEINEGLQPVYDWFNSLWDSIGGGIKDFIDASVPFVKEGWAIIKAITQVTWDLVKEVIDAAVEFCKPIISSFVDTVKDWFGGLGGFLTGEHTASWASFKDAALRFLITLEWGIKNWQTVATLAWDMIKLKMLEFVQGLEPIAQAVQSFLNTMIDGFNAVTAGLGRTISSTINSLIDSYNAFAEKAHLSTIDFHVQVDGTQLNHVNLAIANVGDSIAELRAKIGEELGAIDTDLAAFIEQRLADLNRVAAQTAQQVAQAQAQANNPAIQKIDNKGAERGSVEAYSILVGQSQDKMYNVLNDLLAEQRNANDLDRAQLRELQRRQILAVARF